MSHAVAAPYQRAARHFRAPHLLRVGKAYGCGPTVVRRDWAWPDVLDALIEVDAEAASRAAAAAEREAKRG